MSVANSGKANRVRRGRCYEAFEFFDEGDCGGVHVGTCACASTEVNRAGGSNACEESSCEECRKIHFVLVRVCYGWLESMVVIAVGADNGSRDYIHIPI